MKGTSHEQQTSLIRAKRKGLFFELEVQNPIVSYRSKKFRTYPLNFDYVFKIYLYLEKKDYSFFCIN